MPSRNIVKAYAPDSYYHVYNRGVEKRRIFLDDQDHGVFLNLLKRYLAGQEERDPSGRRFDDLSGAVELLAFCLMPNHFHLLIYQHDPKGMSKLLQRVMTAYVGYFNRKHTRVGCLFQDRFKAALIDREPYLWHISRYIHLNPLDLGLPVETYAFSSYRYYLGQRQARWLHPQRILALHEHSHQRYADFVGDSVDYKRSLADVKRLVV